MNLKRLFICIGGVFLFIFASDFVIHGMLLTDLYQQTSHLWRPQEEMKMAWMLAGQFIVSVFFCLIFTKGYEHRGIGEGIRYGLLMGAFAAGSVVMQYSYMPLPLELIGAWIASTFVQSVLAGLIMAALYRK